MSVFVLVLVLVCVWYLLASVLCPIMPLTCIFFTGSCEEIYPSFTMVRSALVTHEWTPLHSLRVLHNPAHLPAINQPLSPSTCPFTPSLSHKLFSLLSIAIWSWDTENIILNGTNTTSRITVLVWLNVTWKLFLCRWILGLNSKIKLPYW